MKLLPYSELPFFNEMVTILKTNQIVSWQANDFLKKIQLSFDVEKTNINYQAKLIVILGEARKSVLLGLSDLKF